MASKYARGCGTHHVLHLGFWLLVAVGAMFAVVCLLTEKRESELNNLPHLPEHRTIQTYPPPQVFPEFLK